MLADVRTSTNFHSFFFFLLFIIHIHKTYSTKSVDNALNLVYLHLARGWLSKEETLTLTKHTPSEVCFVL